jgi:hypothetical protein
VKVYRKVFFDNKRRTPAEVDHLWKSMKRNNLVPNRDSYKLLVRAFAMEGQADEPIQVR